ncbi:MAG: DEAD/DEAH box helicase [Acidimicrobiia bacterium]|nr:DEAD/DEAH box helicase [Acidimicrobiia bacterium]
MALSTAASEQPTLYRWQFEALVSWLRCGRRGVIEAVTGSGKTDVAIAAAADALQRGRFVLVVVPSRVLMEQWHGRLRAALPDARIGRLGDTGKDRPASCDVLVATRHSAAAHKPVPPDGGDGLLIADECHGLGGGTLRRAMLRQYDERLGLTATLERSDDGVTELLLPYFGGICHRYGFAEAIEDGVCAPPRVALVGVELTVEERVEYSATEQQLVNARQHLRQVGGMPLEPFGDFLAAIAHLAERDAGADGRAARDYLEAFSKRREIVARSSGKYELLGRLANAIRDSHGALVFTETVRAANHAINRLDPHVSIDLITGSTARRQRREILDDLRVRKLDAVAAPRVLDEGVDVPDANLGIVMSASRSRRQMIQRMGRILRRKQPGIAARFVIMYAKGTVEDPANRIERDGFLDEIERIADAIGVFDEQSEALDTFLSGPGPMEVPEPEHLERYERVATAAAGGGPGAGFESRAAVLADEMGAETAYALLSFTQGAGAHPCRGTGLRTLDARLPRPDPDAPYLEVELAALPLVAEPRVKPKRLSTGRAPLEIACVGAGWRISCTGCGESSPPVEFRWQALDQSVVCRCD